MVQSESIDGYSFDGRQPLKWTSGREREEYSAESEKVNQMIEMIKHAGTLARAKKMVEVFNESYYDPYKLNEELQDIPTVVGLPQGHFILDDNGTQKHFKLTLYREKNPRTRSFQLHLDSDDFNAERAVKVALEELGK